jgi:hypothetical protein
MHQPIYLHPKSLKTLGVTASTVAMLLLCTRALAEQPSPIDTNQFSPATAVTSQAYTPPGDSRPPAEDHTGGGVRGCGDEIAAIAPRLHAVGQTAAQYPTFVWYNFGEASEPVEFHLYRYQSNGELEEILVTPISTSRKGYMAYTLPANQSALAIGETYLWQVVLYCDTNLEEVGQWTSAEVEIVPSPTNLSMSTTSDIQQAQVFARAGLWYEAIATVYDASSPEAAAFRETLLLNLADLEAQNVSETAINVSDQLREIANAVD